MSDGQIDFYRYWMMMMVLGCALRDQKVVEDVFVGGKRNCQEAVIRF